MLRFALPLALGLSLLAGRALANARLIQTAPAAGSTTPAPARLWLRFSEFARLPGTGAELVYPDGHMTRLTLLRDPRDSQAMAAVLPRLAPGRYEVRWRALSPNAHPTHGDFNFTVGH